MPTIKQDETNSVVSLSSNEYRSDFFIGTWENYFSSYDDPGVFVVHVEFLPDGTTTLWDGYKNSELWYHYSGRYEVVEKDHDGSVVLCLNTTSNLTNYQTYIRIDLVADNKSGLYTIKVSHVRGDELGVFGNIEQEFGTVGSGVPIRLAKISEVLPEDDVETLKLNRKVFFKAYGVKVEFGAKADDVLAHFNQERYGNPIYDLTTLETERACFS